MTILDDLIARANNVLGALEGLIEGDAAETPIVDTSVPYDFPAIAFDEANDAWTLTQDTADNADGLYKGVFLLALETGCAVLTVVSHNVTTPGNGIPARYQVCGAGSFTDVTSMTTLNNKQIDKLEIRSAAPFEVKVKLTQSWCYEFDFTETNGDWVVSNTGGNSHGTWMSGTGWQYTDALTGNEGYRMVFIERALPAGTTIIEYKMVYDFTEGSTTDVNRGTIQLSTNVGLLQQLTFANSTDGTALEYTWQGSQNVNLLRCHVRSSVGNSGNPNYSGNGLIRSVKVRGTGTNPFGASTC